MITFSTADVLQRLRKKAGVTTNKELAELLSVNDKTLSGWNIRNSFPIEVLMFAAEKFSVSFDWLITGEERKIDIDPMSEMLLSGFNQLNASQKLKAVTYIGNLVSSNQE